MKISAINGSPKIRKSLSGKIIGQIKKRVGGQIKTWHAAKLVESETPPETLAEILDADILLLVFPLYIDGMPAPLIEFLVRLEGVAGGKQEKPLVYTIVNCGFFESNQTAIALEMAECFANRAALPWGYGLGIGGGPVLSGMGEQWGKWPVKGIDRTLSKMADAIRDKTTGKNEFAEPGFPRFFHKVISNRAFHKAVKKRGAQARARPYMAEQLNAEKKPYI